ncbi:type II secretion system protein GspI [Allofranklinella schreckenbergeri]|uniref:Type II secretion system protein I n=1 Tax=Allofranklinella schreckenbergeri TaxID=1076744 RepID=A0A3M6Q337_9BURK|nr:type II secretion system minor pseudopilin GspI [Allofranklinella schreckenbergeri]RMW97633.1 type II secretion system protein GspI [Allofranklinella schreckenbergeri]RMX02764.1 type II secretion system protein GspI [Allofranklinella schreckenbergeri]RMX11404.1 type II secretion system protein GspI [Allofranklinella schreckenbergeri]RRD40307.1 type II secretion system protein GspI [Comamonadaceae bacterium OH3737_COT-264]
MKSPTPLSALRTATPPARGFTLVEVLVALAVVAIALAAGTRVAGALLHSAERRQDVLLAQWCAENALVEMRLLARGQLPSIGATRSPCEQAGRRYEVELVTSGTINPSLRRVDARVSTPEHFVLSLSTLVGRF